MNIFRIIFIHVHTLCIYIYTSNHSRRYHVPRPCLFCCHIFLLSSKYSKVHTTTHVPWSRASNCKWQEITESESEPDSGLSISEFLRIDKHPGDKKGICYGDGIGIHCIWYTLPLWGLGCCQAHHLLGPTTNYMSMCVKLFVTLYFWNFQLFNSPCFNILTKRCFAGSIGLKLEGQEVLILFPCGVLSNSQQQPVFEIFTSWFNAPKAK